jgi:deazaflavin-dependent oxidoreductase (nitroreductase family)
MTTLAEALGFEPTPPNQVQRLAHRVASSRPGAWILSKVLEPMDKLVLRATNGRSTAAGVLGAVPVITLTTAGASTGALRSSLVLGIPLQGRLAIIGTNYGQSSTPGWVYNLDANPRADVTYRATTVPVIARPADDAEVEQAFERSAAIYAGYLEYRKRVDHRRIRVFLLEVAP